MATGDVVDTFPASSDPVVTAATGEPTLEIPVGQTDTGTVGHMNAGNGLVLVSYGAELIVVS